MSVALLLGIGAAFGGLAPILTDVGWWFTAFGVAAFVTLAIIGLRALVRWLWLPPVVGFVVLVASLTFAFTPGLGYLGVIPSPESIMGFVALINAGAVSIGGQGIPADPTTGIVFMLTTGAGLLVLLLDLVAQLWKRPALVGLPLLAVLGIPTVLVGGESDPFFFLVTAAAYLFVLYLGLGEVRTGGALGVGAVAVLAALILPLVLPPIAEPEASDTQGGFAINVDTFIDLGDNLRRPNVSRVLTYSNPTDEPQYLTVSVISDFSGESWGPSAPAFRAQNPLSAIGPVPGLSDEIRTERLLTAVTIINMGGHWAPVPYAPRSVSGLDDAWTFDDEALTVSAPNESVRGAKYEVSVERVHPTVEQLRAVGTTVDSPGLGDYLAMPDNTPAIIVDTAAEVAGAEATNYDKAIALQKFFAAGSFGYSETAPEEEGYDGTGTDVIAQFLEAKSGYCVHFSSAMAVMARSLGIPARIAVGFTPGEFVQGSEGSTNYYSVTTANLHAWPELWFDGVGWVRFEPTPTRGFADSFDSADIPVDVDPTNVPTFSPTTAPTFTSVPTPSATSGPVVTGPEPDTVIPRIVLAVIAGGILLVLLLPLVPIIIRGLRRLRRSWRVARRGSAVDAWLELTDTAIDLGWAETTLTPRQFAGSVRKGMGEKAVRALAELLVAVEHTAFSREQGTARLRDLRIVRRAMRRLSSRRDLLRAFFTPSSVRFRARRR